MRQSRLTSTDMNVHIDRYERSHRPIRAFTPTDVSAYFDRSKTTLLNIFMTQPLINNAADRHRPLRQCRRSYKIHHAD